MWLKRIFIALLIIALDLFVYLVLAFFLMNYEDFYTPEDGPWYSWQSMDKTDRIAMSTFILWNILNWIAATIIIHKLLFRFVPAYKVKFSKVLKLN
ncbi:MAG: hypothetical protein N4A46_00065 [Schleiferiaceae bacterium]|jgi:hypothetical protein|nr:hypothetical protein [Schleiferiaceae bacterium]